MSEKQRKERVNFSPKQKHQIPPPDLRQCPNRLQFVAWWRLQAAGFSDCIAQPPAKPRPRNKNAPQSGAQNP